VKISKVLVLLILSVVTVLANVSSAFADGCFIPRYSVDITEPAQKAIIVYENNRENLILQVKYDGNVSDFAWVVPVPSYPSVNASEPLLFADLAHLTAAWPQEKTGYLPLFLAFGIMFYGGTFGTAGITGINGGEVWETGNAGIFDYAIISANTSQALVGWLNTNGYPFPMDKLDVLDSYVNKSWYFVAIKLNVSKDAEGLSDGTVQPIELSFNSSQIVYPLKISSVSSEESDVLLYIFADQLMVPSQYPSRFITQNQIVSLNRGWWNREDGVFYVEYGNRVYFNDSSIDSVKQDMAALKQDYETAKQRYEQQEQEYGPDQRYGGFDQMYFRYEYYDPSYSFLTDLLAGKKYYLTKLVGNISASNMADVELVTYQRAQYKASVGDGWNDAGDDWSYGASIVIFVLLLLLLCLILWSESGKRKPIRIWAVITVICGIVLLSGLILQSLVLQAVGFFIPLLYLIVVWLWFKGEPIVPEAEPEERAIGRARKYTIAVAVCGLVAIISIFLPWQSLSVWGYTFSVSGLSLLANEPAILFMGTFASALIVSALLIYRESAASRNTLVMRFGPLGILIFAIVVLISALLPVFEAVDHSASSLIGYGLYMSGVAAFLGLHFAGQLVITMKSINKRHSSSVAGDSI
jgi:hypothetical protein